MAKAQAERVSITQARSRAARQALDALLWEVLWRPLGLPRDSRGSFRLAGEELELAAWVGKELAGGLVAVWTGPAEVEIRHLAVRPGLQRRGVGERLMAALLARVAAGGCRRVHTVARNTSAPFFERLGFAPSGPPLEHPAFQRHGIVFVPMARDL